MQLSHSKRFKIMARRRTKKRTHVGANNGPPGKAPNPNSISRAPKSMVIRIGAGEVGPSVSQLVRDVRAMMEPDTASRLKERRSNRLRDYLTMAGPLGVSHLLLFSRSDTGNTNLRLALTPRGPTLHFRVEKYSLCKDIRKALNRPKGSGREHLTPPLVIWEVLVFAIWCLQVLVDHEQFQYSDNGRLCRVYKENTSPSWISDYVYFSVDISADLSSDYAFVIHTSSPLIEPRVVN